METWGWKLELVALTTPSKSWHALVLLGKHDSPTVIHRLIPMTRHLTHMTEAGLFYIHVQSEIQYASALLRHPVRVYASSSDITHSSWNHFRFLCNNLLAKSIAYTSSVSLYHYFAIHWKSGPIVWQNTRGTNGIHIPRSMIMLKLYRFTFLNQVDLSPYLYCFGPTLTSDSTTT